MNLPPFPEPLKRMARLSLDPWAVKQRECYAHAQEIAITARHAVADAIWQVEQSRRTNEEEKR